MRHLLIGKIDTRLFWGITLLFAVLVTISCIVQGRSVFATAMIFPGLIAAIAFKQRIYLLVVLLLAGILALANFFGSRTLIVDAIFQFIAGLLVLEMTFLGTRGLRRADAARSRREQNLRLLDEIRDLMQRENSIQLLLERTVREIHDRLGYHRIEIFELRGDILFLRSNIGLKELQRTIPLTRGVVGRTARLARTQYVPDTTKDEHFFADTPDISSEISVPLFKQDTLYGVINVEASRHADRNTLGPDDVALIERIGKILGLALERAQHLEALAASRDQALAALNAKAVFLSTMSHELRTPLHTIIASTEIMREDAVDDQQKQLAGMALDAAQNLTKILGDILDFSRAELGKLKVSLKPIDLAALSHQVAGLMAANYAKTELLISVEPAVGNPMIALGDDARVRQILINLISNAIKFTDRGNVLITVQDERTRMRVLVQDTGIGLTEGDITRLFEPFSQVDGTKARAYEGTGLGLAICKQLVSLMGGEIGATGSPGQGATFWFVLPAAA